MQYCKWQLAFDTGWTFDVIDKLPYSMFREYLQLKDAENKAKRT